MPRAPTTPKKKATTSVTRNVSGGDNGIVIGGNVVDSVVHNTVNQNIFQKIFINIFKPDTESLDQRNRRILLGHVENFWVKGVLEKSLHGAAMLELGIKEDPEAVTYPWAIKKEATGETLPAGTSMLEIFEQIGMERSLLILGAPGSGKTTMLLELARQLIERARQNVDEPIPMVFNLASWTEKLTLADWLAQELNNIYYVPRKTAPNWVKGNKLLLLLDGLDEVKQESRAKCVDAINGFRKEHGLTSLTVCSRSQDYEELGAKLAFEGAVEVQPLTQKQVNEFFKRFGKEMAGLKSVLKKDNALREMAETPLFLSIMVMAYRDRQDMDIFVSQNLDIQRKYLFDTYIEHVFENLRSNNIPLKKHKVVHWLSWLAKKMKTHNQSIFLIENLQYSWCDTNNQLTLYNNVNRFLGGCAFSMAGIVMGCIAKLSIPAIYIPDGFGWYIFLYCFWLCGLGGYSSAITYEFSTPEIKVETSLGWSWSRSILGFLTGLLIAYITVSTPLLPAIGLLLGIESRKIDQITKPNQAIWLSLRNSTVITIIFWGVGTIFGILVFYLFGFYPSEDSYIFVLTSSFFGLFFGIMYGLKFGGGAFIKHFSLRFSLFISGKLPWQYSTFLDLSADRVLIQKVGGGYKFIHRLLLEHFANT